MTPGIALARIPCSMNGRVKETQMAGRKDSKQTHRDGGTKHSKDSERKGAQATPGIQEKQGPGMNPNQRGQAGIASENERQRSGNDMSNTEDMD
jgi:hypothetical protein